MTNKLKVEYRNRLVGFLILSKDNKILFQYDETWIKSGFSLNPFKLPLRDTIFESNSPYFDGLFGVFADSLPDSYGKLIIDKYLRTKGIKLDQINVIDKLSIIGDGGMGALEYKPSKEIDYDDSVDLDIFHEEVTKLLESKPVKNLELLYKFAGSSGGTRPKALIKEKNDEFIVKFPSRFDVKNIVDIEYEYTMAAKDCGINVPNCEIIQTLSGRRLFKIKRFDRVNGEKIHMISAAALLEFDFRAPSIDYLDLLKLTLILTKNDDDVLEMYRRMVFNVIFENQDDHGKNFSYLYDENIKMYKLAPAYDLTKSYTYYGEHTTSVNGKGKDIDENDMILVAKKVGIKKEVAKSIIDKIKSKRNSMSIK